jgi:hypothetical protein
MKREETDAAARRWIEGYLRAWESNEPDDIRALFTEDAEYRDDPWTVPSVGHDAIIASWLQRRDEPGSFAFEWDVAAVDGHLVAVQGVTTYDRGTVYSNLWMITLDDSGRKARSFTEWWMDQANPS